MTTNQNGQPLRNLTNRVIAVIDDPRQTQAVIDIECLGAPLLIIVLVLMGKAEVTVKCFDLKIKADLTLRLPPLVDFHGSVFPEYFHVLFVDLVEARHHLGIDRVQAIAGGLFSQLRLDVGIGRVGADHVCRQALPFAR